MKGETPSPASSSVGRGRVTDRRQGQHDDPVPVVSIAYWLAVTPSTWAMNRRMRRWCPPFQYTEPQVSHCPKVA